MSPLGRSFGFGLGILAFATFFGVACATPVADDDDSADGGKKASTKSGACEAPLQTCGSSCVDVTSDPSNCGSCGNVCPSGTCSESACVAAAAAPPPPAAADGGADSGSRDEVIPACTSNCGQTLRVRGYIDGGADLVLRGTTVHWFNAWGAAPGRWDGKSVATTLNGSAWMPEWPAQGENRDCKCSSKPAPRQGQGALAQHPQTVGLKIVDARNTITIDQPTAANNYTATVHVVDTDGGAEWYEFELTYDR